MDSSCPGSMMVLNGALLFCCNSQDAAKREAVDGSGSSGGMAVI